MMDGDLNVGSRVNIPCFNHVRCEGKLVVGETET